MNPKNNNFNEILKLVRRHENLTKKSLYLIASENRMNPRIAKVLSSDLGNRVAEGWLGQRMFPGIKYYDEIEEYGLELAKNIFKSDFVDIRPLSGTQANTIIYKALTSPGDKVATISLNNGAHVSMCGPLVKKTMNLEVLELPFSYEKCNLDLSKSIKLIKKEKPKLVILGGSVIMFPQPVKEISKICKKIGSIFLFDASHVAGLILSGVYPNPIEDGADIMTMTVCKTIPGPQHAIIACKKEFEELIKKTTFPSFVSGHHLHETVATILSLEEMKSIGKSYTKQIVKNSKMLAKELNNKGFKIMGRKYGFTKTHMFMIDFENSNIRPIKIEKELEEVNIFVNKNMIKKDKSLRDPSGIRIGTQEVTRMGMKENDMIIIADLIFRTISGENKNLIKKEVSKLVNKYNKIKFIL